MNLQSENSLEAQEEEFEEQLQDDISLVGLNPTYMAVMRPSFYTTHSQVMRNPKYQSAEYDDDERDDDLRQPVPSTKADKPHNVHTLKASSTVSGKPTKPKVP